MQRILGCECGRNDQSSRPADELVAHAGESHAFDVFFASGEVVLPDGYRRMREDGALSRN